MEILATAVNTPQKESDPKATPFFCAGNVSQNDASLERLNGVRILANGWRLSERLQPKTKRRNF